MDMKVSEFIVQYLERLNAEYVFGIPGAHILPVYDALYGSSVKPILTKHEQGAAFMAGGYARQSGKVGVCIATAGPGATNLVTGLANAYTDRLPVLALTGETPTYSFGKGALQESSGEGTSINQFDVFRGVTRYSSIVQRTDYMINVFRNATRVLLSRNPGPVLLSFPYNVLKETIDSSILESIRFDSSPSVMDDESLPVDAILSLLNRADHPVIIAGHGGVRSNAEGLLADFATQMNIPVATTLKARGIVPESSPLSLGVLGITSNELAFRYLAEKADLIIIAGASFGERTSYNWNSSLLSGKKVIQVDIDEMQLDKVFRAVLSLRCDVRRFFECLKRQADLGALEPKDAATVDEYKTRYAVPDTGKTEFLLVSHFLNCLNAHFGGEVSVFDDNIIYMQRFCLIAKSSSYFPNSGISSLGHAVPAAIGAKLATERPVVALLGDGGFQMCCMEIMTAVNYGIPVTVIVLNNSSLGLVRKNQHHNYGGRFIACDFRNPSYRQLAEAFGIEYFRVATEDDADCAFRDLNFKDRINLIELILDKDEFPKYSSGR